MAKAIVPSDFFDQLSTLLQLDLVVTKQLPARHSLSYQVKAQEKPMLLKLIDTSLEDLSTKRRENSLYREAQLLIDLAEITDDLYISHGKIGSTTWLLRRWIEGVTAVEHSAYIRSRPLTLSKKQRFVTDLCHMLKKVIRLDELGYLHGDLQPRHFIIDQTGKFSLIDLELAVSKKNPESGYTGALIHYVSPETASGMLEKKLNIPLDSLSEVYSFGAVAFTLYTGQTATVYNIEETDTRDSSFEEQLKAIVQGHIRSFTQANVEPFPELEQVLRRCLEVDRSIRYQSFESILNALEYINIVG